MNVILNKLRSEAYWKSVYIITRKSLNEQYRNSFLGMLWSVIQPLVNIMVMAVVFSVLWRMPLKTYFTYLFSGMLCWQFMTGAITRAAGAINSRRGVFHHTILPKSMFVVADFLTQFYVFFITFLVIYAIKLVVGGFSPTIVALPLVLLPLMVFTIAVSFMAAYISAYIWDTPHIIGILFGVLYWTVPIIYPISIVPPQYQVYFENNPLYWLISPVQQLISAGTLPSLSMYMYAMATALGALMVSYFVFRKLHRNVIYYI